MIRERGFMAATVLLCVCVLVACETGGGVSEMPTAAVVNTRVPHLSTVVPFGPSETRDLPPTTEVVSNCAGVTEPVIKHPYVNVASAHSIEWEVGGMAGTGAEIGSDLLPGKINLSVALEGRVAQDVTQSIYQGVAWGLPADPGYIVSYTLMWRETWQPAYVDVTFMDPEPEILRIDVNYRTGIQSEIVGQDVMPCNTLPVTESTSVIPSVVPGQISIPTLALPSPTSAPVPVSFVDLPVYSEAGVVWTVPSTGLYSFGIESGAYNGWPTDSECAVAVPDRPGCWRSRLSAYIGCEISWGRPDHSPEMSEPMFPSFTLGDFTYLATLEAAQELAVRLALQTVPLNANDCIRFVVIDGYNPETGFSAYADNRGDPERNNSMVIKISGPQ